MSVERYSRAIPGTFRQAPDGERALDRVPLTDGDMERIVVRVVDHGPDTGHVAGQR